MMRYLCLRNCLVVSLRKREVKPRRKKAPAPAKKEAVNESVGTEKSALNEEAPENSLSAPNPANSDAQPLDDKPPSGLINMNAGLDKEAEKIKEANGNGNGKPRVDVIDAMGNSVSEMVAKITRQLEASTEQLSRSRKYTNFAMILLGADASRHHSSDGLGRLDFVFTNGKCRRRRSLLSSRTSRCSG